MQIPLQLGGRLFFKEGFLSKELADQLAEELQRDIEWDLGVGLARGKEFVTPRLIATMYDETDLSDFAREVITTSWNYGLSESRKNVSVRWTRLMKYVKDHLESIFGVKISYAQFNWYKTDQNYVGWHSDAQMSQHDYVFSMSLGASRHFSFRDKNLTSGPPEVDIKVTHGSLVYFDSDAGRNNYRHQLRKALKRDEYHDDFGYGRINVTFRTTTSV